MFIVILDNPIDFCFIFADLISISEVIQSYAVKWRYEFDASGLNIGTWHELCIDIGEGLAASGSFVYISIRDQFPLIICDQFLSFFISLKFYVVVFYLLMYEFQTQIPNSSTQI